MRRTLRCVLAAAMLTSFLAACGSDDKDDKAAAPAATELRVTVTDVGDQVKLDLPAKIDGGVVNLSLTNSGEGPHSLQFVKVAGDHTTADIIAFLASDEEGGPVPDWISEGGGIGTVAPGQTGTSSFKLTDGKHFVWDDETGGPDDKNNGTRGGVAEVDVDGNGAAGLPTAVGSISAKEYEFTVQNLKAGATTVRFENTGKEFHHFIAAPIAAGKSLDDVKAFFAAQGQVEGPPPLDFEKGVGAPVMDSGNAVVLDLQLKAGDYAMVCFINDRTGGPPHFTLGMLQKVTVA